jgi:C4-dicarboxylate-specific signal transduction histidine kinase
MIENTPDILRQKQLLMVGRMLASFTHELKNHLAIIKESNGLLSDLLAMGSMADSPIQARLQKITETINKRVLLTAEMAKHLNGFAHRNDTPTSIFQLNDIINEELAFLTRFADLQSIAISISLSNTLPVLLNNPSMVQYIFASLFFHVLQTLKPGQKLDVFSTQQDRFVCFGLQAEGEKVHPNPDLTGIGQDQAIQEALSICSASLSLQPKEHGGGSIVGTIPISAGL